jgi:hypothetical protein
VASNTRNISIQIMSLLLAVEEEGKAGEPQLLAPPRPELLALAEDPTNHNFHQHIVKHTIAMH